MVDLVRSPFIVLSLLFVLLCLSAQLGVFFRRRKVLEEAVHQDLDLVTAATLTLLGLIIGFSFSMANTRYDQRKNYEEAEANAIGTEYLRTDLLPSADGVQVRRLLRDYLNQRILFYKTRDQDELRKINGTTAELQGKLWAAVQVPAAAQPTPMLALAVSGMNDVLNSQGYTQAAWWNRIPSAAWGLMAAMAIVSNLLVGYGARRSREGVIHSLILPLVLSVAFFLIADIDSPRRGVIRVIPQNLVSLAESLAVH
jgi:hypothetical protein